MALQLQSLAGLAAIPLLAWLLSENRSGFNARRAARLVSAGLALQIVIAGAMLNLPILRAAFDAMAGLVGALQSAVGAGMRLVFGYLAGAPAPYETLRPENSFVLAFQALPLILLISALSRLLYHWGVLQRVVGGFAWGLQRTLGVSGPVGIAAAANIFVGMVEAPLLIRPYISKMSRSALFATMTVGMATVAGTVLALYASILGAGLTGAAGHLIVASVISAPAALMIAALMVPEDAAKAASKEAGEIKLDDDTRSSIDAISQGTRDGIILLANVTAMLIVFVALVVLANKILALVTAPFAVVLTVEQILGWLFAPMAWLIGIPIGECLTAGSLLGLKTVLNELVAYIELAKTPPELLSDRSRLILTYALCGFANFGSLGIMIGGLSAMAPGRRAEIVSLGAKSIISGTFATLMTGAVVGLMTAS